MTATVDRTDLDRTRFFIDNEWVEPRGADTHRALEAATGEPLGTAALGTDADIDAAVRAARRALDEGPWGRSTAAERAEAMHRFAAALTARADGTSKLVSQENGMPIGLSSAFNGAAPAGLLQMYAEQVKSMDLEEVRPSPSGSTIVRREPVGVVGAIAPWNYPQVLAMMKIAPALAAGCTIVLKPSPETALDSYVMGDAAKEAGLPPGVLNIVLADREAGASLVSHPLVSGGGRPKSQDRGWFVEPTVFADVKNSDRLAREEVFGPVMTVIPFDDDEDAIRIANDSNYGLGGSVWTADESRGIDVSRRVRTGTVGVNYYNLDLGAPFGGMKDSGIGRELGPEAINPYLEYKSIFASAEQLKG